MMYLGWIVGNVLYYAMPNISDIVVYFAVKTLVNRFG
jgi:hypothetical protein